LLIKYIKSVLWRVAKCLSYIEEARCLKVKNDLSYTSTPSHTLVTSLFYKQQWKSYPLLVVVCKSVSSEGDPTCRKEHPCLMHGRYSDQRNAARKPHCVMPVLRGFCFSSYMSFYCSIALE